ncbi:MAG: DNA repair protein RecN [Clostridia bacterium]|nr:DNA repair protein RecN [Clostridia bacterium]
MLSFIHIKNIAIIEELEIDFNKGLNVLTGETGVGKSIIINAIIFALGARASKDLIRKGASSASCEMIFSLNEDNVKEILELENIEIEDNEIVISRTLNDSGKNIFKINGTVVSSNVMKDITSKIIDIHGQHEHQSLFDVSRHIMILDGFDKKNIIPLRDEITKKYFEYKEVKNKLNSLLGDDADRERKIDMLEYQINEIEDAKLNENEDEELEKKRSAMLGADKLSNGSQLTHDALTLSDDNILKAIKELEKIEKYDDSFKELIDSLNEAEVLINDAKLSISDYMDNLYFDPAEQEKVEMRLDLIDKLKRKYGEDINKILEYKDARQTELDEIYNSEDIINELKDKKKKMKDEIIELSAKLTKLRKNAAKVCCEKIESNLKDLEMKNAKFEIQITPREKISSIGMDEVEFMFTSNLGEELKPLDKIASGGEISRVMLAIKNVLAGNDEIQILVFDEIDTGISGKAAQAVAEKMIELACEHQILCITHLPQIAAMADYHYEIAKTEKDGRTISNIRLLEGEDDIKELARLVTGAEMTDTALAHAKELKEQANKVKEKINKK